MIVGILLLIFAIINTLETLNSKKDKIVFRIIN